MKRPLTGAQWTIIFTEFTDNFAIEGGQEAKTNSPRIGLVTVCFCVLELDYVHQGEPSAFGGEEDIKEGHNVLRGSNQV